MLPDWFVFTPWGFAGFILFIIAANAEANRSPFDLPEGESEIIAGYFIEYSGFKFALFFLGEYLGLFAVSGLGITLFLGGWHAPFAALDFIPSWAWFFAKLLALIVLFIWTRGTLPRLRVDQLMNFAWKFMLPMALINLVAAAVWHFMPPGLPRWLVCGTLVVAPYLLLGRGAVGGKELAKRIYRYALTENESLFIIIAVLTIAAAVAAMTLRNLVHCALAVAVAFAGLGGGVSATRRPIRRLRANPRLCRRGGDPHRVRRSAHARRRAAGGIRFLRVMDLGRASPWPCSAFWLGRS